MTMMRGFVRVVVVLVAVVVISQVFAASTPTVLRGVVVRVADGDTITVRARGFETPIRLIGIDTPETKRPGYPVQCGGPAASAETKRLLAPGTSVRIESDPSQDTRDRYNRFLGYVYLAGRGGARGSINYRLVATGFAKTYIYGGVPFRYAGEFLGAQIGAKNARRGVWGSPCNGNTVKPQYGSAPSTGTNTTAATTPLAPLPHTLPTGSCDANYSGACIPPPPPDLDCSQITARRFRVVGTDVHRFDSNHDGIACEGAARP
ncbi:MAG: nuclease [Thermoleophilia bacterium]|nr:nuclease [Thermoleophilia bacterium]